MTPIEECIHGAQKGGVGLIATGLNFPDALAGGPAAGIQGGPVLLTQLLEQQGRQLHEPAPHGVVDEVG